MIDVGAANTRMSVIQNGVFTMTRTIPNGAQMLTEALKGYFKLSEDDAEQGKAQLDIADLIEDAKPRENPLLRVIQPHVDDLVREIRRSLNYFQSQLSEGNQGKRGNHLAHGRRREVRGWHLHRPQVACDESPSVFQNRISRPGANDGRGLTWRSEVSRCSGRDHEGGEG